MRHKDLTGLKFGKLTVLKQSITTAVGTNCFVPQWLCMCDCGIPVLRSRSNLIRSKIKEHTCTTNCILKTRPSTSYSSWKAMKQRCNNPSSPKYTNYGARGITYDPAWETFAGFYKDMGERPHKYTIERRDNMGNYTKNNCSWENKTTQARNTRATILSEDLVSIIHTYALYIGKEGLSPILSKQLGIPTNLIRAALQRKSWSEIAPLPV